MKKDILPELLYKWYLEAKENLNGKRFSELSNKQKTIFIYLAQRVNKIEQARDKWVLGELEKKVECAKGKGFYGMYVALYNIRKIFNEPKKGEG